MNDGEDAPAPPLEGELEDWNQYASKMNQRAIERLLALALREVVEGRVGSGLRLVGTVHNAGAELGKQEFMMSIQRFLSANALEARAELELLREERSIEQLFAPLTGRR